MHSQRVHVHTQDGCQRCTCIPGMGAQCTHPVSRMGANGACVSVQHGRKGCVCIATMDESKGCTCIPRTVAKGAHRPTYSGWVQRVHVCTQDGCKGYMYVSRMGAKGACMYPGCTAKTKVLKSILVVFF